RRAVRLAIANLSAGSLRRLGARYARGASSVERAGKPRSSAAHGARALRCLCTCWVRGRTAPSRWLVTSGKAELTVGWGDLVVAGGADGPPTQADPPHRRGDRPVLCAL